MVNVGNSTINLPFADGLYHTYTVILGRIYHWVYHTTWVYFAIKGIPPLIGLNILKFGIP